MKSRWQAVLTGGALFVAGSLAGAGVMRAYDLKTAQSWLRSPVADRRAQLATFSLSRRLDLDDAQREALRAIIDSQRALVEESERARAPWRRKLREDLFDRLEPELRPEQVRQLERLREAARARDEGAR